MSKKKVFISPLDWGLGHATRCIPIIQELRKCNCEVIIGSEGAPLELLKKEFPAIPHLKFPGYNIDYPASDGMAWHMLKSIPQILSRISREQQYIYEISELHKIDGIISDNRYGLYGIDIPSVFITHQLNIQAPIGQLILKGVTNRFIRKFTHCWVPDDSGTTSLAGNLSQQNPPKNVDYVGNLSRLSMFSGKLKKYDIVAIVSGPEPQRTFFEKLVLTQLQPLDKSALVILGQPHKTIRRQEGKIDIRSHLESKEMSRAIAGAGIIISRPGYSTIMDLAVFGKKALFLFPHLGKQNKSI